MSRERDRMCYHVYLYIYKTAFSRLNEGKGLFMRVIVTPVHPFLDVFVEGSGGGHFRPLFTQQ